MKVIVTGASGNVGTSVLEHLARAPDVTEIVGVARRLPQVSYAKTRWQAADITTADLAGLFAGAGVVIHLAWLIQPSRDETATRRVNVDGSARVFDAVAAAGVPALVYASSVGTYAPGPRDHHRVDESWPATGIASSFYSRHKAEVERLLDGFEQSHSDVRVVRLRPALIFKAHAATEIRRLFIGPFLPNRLARRELLPALPLPRGLRTQAVHADDVARAYVIAATTQARGAFNVAAEPVLDAATLSQTFDAPIIELPPKLVRSAASLSWKLRLQPTSPGWLDMGLASPLMDTTRAREELGWSARASSIETVLELLAGINQGKGLESPPLDPRTSGPLRWRELRSGVGARNW